MFYTDLLREKPPRKKKKIAVKPDPSTAISSPNDTKLERHGYKHKKNPRIKANMKREGEATSRKRVSIAKTFSSLRQMFRGK